MWNVFFTGRVGWLLLLLYCVDYGTPEEAHVLMSPDDTCPENSVLVCTFGPEQVRRCTKRAFICDGQNHCPAGEDEDLSGCHRRGEGAYSAADMFVNSNTSLQQTCGLRHYPAKCKCSLDTRLECDYSELDGIPRNVSSRVTHMYLHHNRIQLSKDDLAGFPNLTMLNLNSNGIKHLPPDFLHNQSRLRKLLLRNNNLQQLPIELFSTAAGIRLLMLDGNGLQEFSAAHFTDLPHLLFLNLSDNNIGLHEYVFPSCELRYLELAGNNITRISDVMFRRLKLISKLLLQDNRISYIGVEAFHHLYFLEELNLSHNRLNVLNGQWLRDLGRLRLLKIGFNEIEDIPWKAFHHSENLTNLDLDNLEIRNMSKRIWSGMKKLTTIKFSRFSYCGYVPQVKFCEPKSDGVSSDRNLLATRLHRNMIWIIAGLTCVGNVIVIWGRGFSKAEDSRSVGILVCNLAVADLIMGIYLFIIAGKDMEYREEYNAHALSWMQSDLCAVSGVMAVMSSEVAVLIMTYMSVERFVAIVYPLMHPNSSGRHRVKTISIWMAAIWCTGLTIALIPVFWWPAAGTFYGLNGVCLPIHIQQPFIQGWQYSAAIFLCLNMISVVLIVGSYLIMFINIQQTRRKTTLALKELDVALRFFFIVLTDCLCWLPIVIVKLLALTRVPIPEDVHAWIVVFVLPINSAVNPFLYTFTTTKFFSKIRALLDEYVCTQPRRPSVNVTGSEFIPTRTSLHVIPPPTQRGNKCTSPATSVQHMNLLNAPNNKKHNIATSSL